jgi:hypothetical protein
MILAPNANAPADLARQRLVFKRQQDPTDRSRESFEGSYPTVIVAAKGAIAI